MTAKISEVWKDVVGYEGRYMVSNLGRIRSLSRPVVRGRGGVQILTEKIVSTKKPHYEQILLYKNKTRKDFLVHRIVAIAFLPKVRGKNCINHRDGNKLNNRVENLEWCTHKENTAHAFLMGLMGKRREK